ncbi:hypothetical protein GCM10025868_00980 [Angustibacter aerolatus]|uniref:ANTAR domain-containing protein n=1 Tax=Angustibacter aerolatus TaxID=1162965 RepID=A0ABQ6J9L8_9ACTN|nr:hypothetical protein GCM10025868_00980 [Angustibacter aerolatus]
MASGILLAERQWSPQASRRRMQEAADQAHVSLSAVARTVIEPARLASAPSRRRARHPRRLLRERAAERVGARDPTVRRWVRTARKAATSEVSV